MFNKPLEDRPLDNIKIWLSVQLQQPSKIPESRSYLNEPLSKDYGEEPPFIHIILTLQAVPISPADSTQSMEHPADDA